MRKKLMKSNNNVVLTGTLAGIAEYLNIDPTIVRIIYVFLSLTFIGAPVILYIVMAILIPSNHGERTNTYGHNNKYYRNNNRQTNSRPRKEAEKVEEEDWSDF